MYNYSIEKEKLFTDEGQRIFLKIRDNVKELLELAGAFKITKAFKGVTGDTFIEMACIDRLVELNEIKEVSGFVPGQSRVFIKS